jgi:hypothetical protein
MSTNKSGMKTRWKQAVLHFVTCPTIIGTTSSSVFPRTSSPSTFCRTSPTCDVASRQHFFWHAELCPLHMCMPCVDQHLYLVARVRRSAVRQLDDHEASACSALFQHHSHTGLDYTLLHPGRGRRHHSNFFNSPPRPPVVVSTPPTRGVPKGSCQYQ